jgi:hypothetical protein
MSQIHPTDHGRGEMTAVTHFPRQSCVHSKTEMIMQIPGNSLKKMTRFDPRFPRRLTKRGFFRFFQFDDCDRRRGQILLHAVPMTWIAIGVSVN